MSLPKISCFCCTFGRPHLLEEAIESFLRQDYAGEKELIVLNDFSGHRLLFEHPQVTVINLPVRVVPLGKKFNLAASYCTGDILMPWEDDDIYLPWRLSVSAAQIRDGVFHTRQAWLENSDHELEYSENLYQCNLAIERTVWQQIGGYLEHDVSAIDLALFRALGGNEHTQTLPQEDIFYVYRWQSSGAFHASEVGGNCASISDHAGYIVNQLAISGKLPLGDVQLKPHWQRDYVVLSRCASIPTRSPSPPYVTETQPNTCPVTQGFQIDEQVFINSPLHDTWFLLDPLASTIWQGLQSNKSVSDIALTLHRQYGTDVVHAKADIQAITANFSQEGLLRDWCEPLWLDVAGQAVVVVIQQDKLRNDFKRLFTQLRCDWPVNWDHLLELCEEREFYSVYLDAQQDAELLYADQALYRLIELMQTLQASTTQHATYLQGLLLRVNNQVIAICHSDLSHHAVSLETLDAQQVEVLSYGRFQLTSNGDVQAVRAPHIIPAQQRNALHIQRVTSAYFNDQLHHICEPLPCDEQTRYQVDHCIIATEQLPSGQCAAAQALSILLNEGLIRSPYLSQTQTAHLLSWLVSAHPVAVTPDALTLSTLPLGLDTAQTDSSALSPLQIPQFKRFDKQRTQLTLPGVLPTNQQRADNRQRYAQVNINPSVDLIEWVSQKLEAGESKAQVYRDLIESGYAMEMAEKAMYGFKPKIKTEQIEDASLRESTHTKPSLYFAFANIAITQNPKSIRIADVRAQIFRFEGAFSEQECQSLITRLEGHFQPSTVVDQQGDSNQGYRTSCTACLEQISHQENIKIKNKISALMGIDSAYLESLQIQRYGTGQEYKVHCDFFHESSPSYQKCIDSVGQRTWTCVVYLNDDFSGGNTHFTQLDITVTPRTGMALCWNNLSPLGKPNEYTYHCGQPVESGFKYIISAWFREKPFNKWQQ
ncbi:PqqD family peptide modification chaperone [Pseudoalteromonas sp. McH1-42]|uniref:PqqD family peptide modification chaperone n=1 Tax=Pseudoalteromonas sp. McH1-42 TaxID=2917752 RepID=UPI001EF5D1BF|nr:PqqD family peptide modification chaperone [Pseudoalteromonas sp. McH1-42]MCG7562047.1 PqqD family peptide modification chaperone [Pseudoalteromonas sp. McH1-42]